ncbi:hypothetical protein L873DRAFT_1794573 [Choiromyces venosus 120613-1]|uniref:Uncharacterized protein n=1 Tax=Choiromyces venosus 120613-1 TaxID=1336337 RepID=A0A3N4J4I4_9PEZI|nr:hypothetical protein L873DRAFT_1794573 [Choiromyces venosus 120613-1]
MFTTLQYKPLQDLRRYPPSQDTHPVDPETETDISSQATVPSQLYGRRDKNEMFPLPRPLWSPLSKTGTGTGRSVAPSKEVDPKDTIFHSTETISGSTRVPAPINDVSGTSVPRSILSHPEFRGIRERTTISPGSVAEAVSSAYQYQTRSVSADSFPLLKQTTSIRSTLGNGPELSSRGKAQYGSASDHFMPPKVPIGSSLTSSKGQPVALIQQYMPTRQHPSRAWNSSTSTKEHDGINLDPLYHATISKYFECLQTSPSIFKNNFTAGNRSSTTSLPGLSPFLANKPWIFTMFGRTSAFHTFYPLKAETSVPLGGPAIEAFIHPRHRTYFHQFLRKSVLKSIESSVETKETACEIAKGIRASSTSMPSNTYSRRLSDCEALEEDNESEPKIVDLEENVQLDIHSPPISPRFRRGSAVATRVMEESNTAEFIKVLTSTFHENDNRVTEIDPDTEECDVAEKAPSSHCRTNSLRNTVSRRISLFKSTSVKSKFAFVAEVTATPQLKRKHNPKEDNTEKASHKRTRDNSVEFNVASPSDSIASRLSIFIDNAEQRQVKLNSPGRELILSPINTQCVQVTECMITEPLLSNSIPDSPVTPTSITESAARWSTHSMSSTGTSLTVPYSHESPSASRKLLTEKAWEEEELRGRQPRRAEDESRSLCLPGSGPRRSRSTSALNAERPTEYSVEQTRRRSVSTNSLLIKSAPMFQTAVISTIESQNLEIEETPTSSESSSFIEPAELEDPFISSAPAQPHITLSVPETKPEEDAKKELAQKKGIRRISYLGQSKLHKSFTTKASEPSTTTTTSRSVSDTEDASGNKKKKFQKLKDRVKGITKKVSGAIKKEKY